MTSTGSWGSLLTIPGLGWLLAEHTRNSRLQVGGAYWTLGALGAIAVEVASRLHREGRVPLAVALSSVAAEARRQVASAAERKWLSSTMPAELEVFAEDWKDVPPTDVADALCQELKTLVETILEAVNFAPFPWEPDLLESAARLLAVVARLRSALLRMRERNP